VRHLASLSVALAPAWVWACPMCAGEGANTHRVASYVLLGAFVSVPYLLGGWFLRLVRRLGADSQV